MVYAYACPGAEVTIRVHGQPLPEYDNDDEDNPSERQRNMITQFVECAEGQFFEIHVKLGQDMVCTRTHFHLQFFVDGNFVEGRAIAAEKVEGGDCFVASRGSWGNRYCFQGLNISTDAPPGDEYQRGQLGTIMVKLFHEDKEMRPMMPDNRPHATDMATSYMRPISEKDVKGRAISQGVSFAPLHGHENMRSYDRPQKKRRNNDDRPYVRECGVHRDHGRTFTFLFKYRTLEDLKSLYIVPRTPSPEPLEDRDPEYLNRDELKELLEQKQAELQQSQAAVRALKRENPEERARARKLPRLSPSGSQYTFKREIIVIDDD